LSEKSDSGQAAAAPKNQVAPSDTEPDSGLDAEISNSLRFFPETTPVTTRRRRWFFLAAWCTISALLIWPIYPLFKSATPLILGLPLSLAWILLAMVLMFLALLVLFLGDEREQKAAEEQG